MKIITLIPVYKAFNEINNYEKQSIIQSISKMKDDVAFIGPKKIKVSYDNYFKSIKYFTFQDQYFRDVNGYNKLLKSLHFYKRFTDYSHILISQTDAWIFGVPDDLLKFVDYYYCGAISFNVVGAYGYNGGLSLRNVHYSIKALKSFKNYESLLEIWNSHFNSRENLKPIKIISFILDVTIRKKVHFLLNFFTNCNEDIFWSVLVPKANPGYKVITPEDAVKFSWEHNCENLMMAHDLPFGCHGWWNYNFEFWKDIIEIESKIKS